MIAIVRDLLIIALIVGGFVVGGRFLSAVRDVGSTPADQVYPCATPTSDDFGTFCPPTPGG